MNLWITKGVTFCLHQSSKNVSMRFRALLLRILFLSILCTLSSADFLEQRGQLTTATTIHPFNLGFYSKPSSIESGRITIKRSAPSKYYSAYRRLKYKPRRTFPFEYFDYDYDYWLPPRLRDRVRNRVRRPTGFEDVNYYEYDEGFRPHKWKGQRKGNRNSNKKGSSFYSDEDLSEEVERVTPIIKPRQRQTTTATTTEEPTTLPSMANVTNATTSSTTATPSTTLSSGYGYGPSSNVNVSITYGPPSIPKPLYGIPGASPGAPIGSWVPSFGSSLSYPADSSYYFHPSNDRPIRPSHKDYTVHNADNSYKTHYQIPHQTSYQLSGFDSGPPNSYSFSSKAHSGRYHNYHLDNDWLKQTKTEKHLDNQYLQSHII
ncbi:uncharacterized protein LOC115882189 [Sitophilus oryzae]|uniref:Uncharacterized protein LOC115882189 n=1 Tax=Sitophilus oryzae TaxID=7048 RepID=A0A6J2XWQ7_SITOR|nr:uncharacterized protein LOC115882189 [Sitophilus oryzae]